MRYAPFWRRVAATIVDVLLMSVVALPLWGAVLSLTAARRGIVDSEAERAAMRADPTAVNYRQVLILFPLMPIVFLVGWPYFTLMESSARQGTLGKLALGIKVTDLDGRRIRWPRATGRYFGRWLSQLPLLTGFLLPLVTPRRQALHDLLSKCVVILR